MRRLSQLQNTRKPSDGKVQKWLSLIIILWLGCAGLSAQSDVSLVWETTPPVYQQDWQVELRFANALSLSTAQFGLAWESEALLLNTVSTGEDFSTAITNQQASSYTFSWLSTAAEGVALAEETLLLRLNFTLLSCPEDSVRLQWDTEGVPPQFTTWSNDSLIVLSAVLLPLATTSNAPELWEVSDTSICPGTNLLLTPDCPNCTAWAWNDGSSAPTLLVATSGNYSVTVEDNNECTFSDSITVATSDLPELILNDTTICPEDTLTLTVPAADGADFIWSTGDMLPTVLLSAPGAYALTITNTDGCQNADTLILAFQSPVITTTFLTPMTACVGDTITVSVDGPDSLVWLSPDIMGPDAAGDFRFVGRDTLVNLTLVGVDVCENDTVDISAVFSEPLGYAMPDTCITPGSEVTLEAFNGKAYTWRHPRFAVTPPNQAVGVSSPTDTASYIVEILDENGCVTVDTVYVAIANDPATFIRPINFISPNGDGHNDVLEFTGLEKYTNNDLVVWNRWNQVVYRKEQYQSDDERFAGDGHSAPLPDGTYYYRLRVDGIFIDQQLIILRHEQ